MRDRDAARQRAVLIAAQLSAFRAGLSSTDCARVTRHALRVFTYGRSPAWAVSCAVKLAVQLGRCHCPDAAV